MNIKFALSNRQSFFCIIVSAYFTLTACPTDPAIESQKLNCDSVVTAMRKNADHSINKPVYIVLCDYTSSMDNEGTNYVTEKALGIFDAYYNKATIKFYPVSNQLRSALFTSEMTIITDSGNVEESAFINYKHCLDILQPEQRTFLKDTLTAIAGGGSSASYILQSIENATAIINLYDPLQKNSNRIYILSDMLESGKSTFGYINLEDKSYSSDISKVENYNNYPATQKFSSNINLYIGCNAKNINDMNSLNKFWNVVLNKMGYQNSVKLTSEIPVVY